MNIFHMIIATRSNKKHGDILTIHDGII